MAEKTIILIEDDRFLRRAAEASLKKQGFTVLTAVDGEEGLTLARKERADLILLDLLMPKINGIDLLRMLKGEAFTRKVPIVILSNSSHELEMKQALELGARDYWVKANLSLQELTGRIIKLLEE
jgi:two-component system alkaline phosphatase synthesis response regulator PhoP